MAPEYRRRIIEAIHLGPDYFHFTSYSPGKLQLNIRYLSLVSTLANRTLLVVVCSLGVLVFVCATQADSAKHALPGDRLFPAFYAGNLASSRDRKKKESVEALA